MLLLQVINMKKFPRFLSFLRIILGFVYDTIRYDTVKSESI